MFGLNSTPARSTGGTLGAAVFSVKGNQGQSWIPANVRYEGPTDIQVNAGIPCIAEIVLIMHDLFANNIF